LESEAEGGREAASLTNLSGDTSSFDLLSLVLRCLFIVLHFMVFQVTSRTPLRESSPGIRDGIPVRHVDQDGNNREKTRGGVT